MTSFSLSNNIVIRFAGDSGDGIQITGQQMASVSAILGNDIHSFPDFPAEIRAPAGTLAGVSGFQLNFSSSAIHTEGDGVDTLVVFNPAALKANIQDLKSGGVLILDQDKFTERDLKRAGYEQNPLESDQLKTFQTVPVRLKTLTLNALEPFDLTHAKKLMCRNMFALGIVCWLFERPLKPIQQWIERKYAKKDQFIEPNHQVLQAGFHFAETLELLPKQSKVHKAQLPPGRYKHVTGNQALCLGLLAVAEQAKKGLLVAGYPITPASEVLLEMAQYESENITVFQAEDEIAAACSAIGASFGGALGFCVTSGPGFDLKGESLGLAATTELPMVLANIQRAGPSTGMPTKTEQSDLRLALYGRHGESSIPILAARSPSDCFATMIEAFQIAVKFMTPVIVLSDAYLANGAEPWAIPQVSDLPKIDIGYEKNNTDFQPYQRDIHTLARPWAIPGTKELMHRLGGLEKDSRDGSVSYEPENHEKMTRLREAKIQNIQSFYPTLKILGDPESEVLITGWGSTYGVITEAIQGLRNEGYTIAHVHLRHLLPLPKDLGAILEKFETIIVPELNTGHLADYLQSQYARPIERINKIMGKPFKIEELKTKLLPFLKESKKQNRVQA